MHFRWEEGVTALLRVGSGAARSGALKDHAAGAQVLLRAEGPHRGARRDGPYNCTKYGRNRNSPTNFIPHHVQRISKAVVMYDSLGICSQVTVKKRQAYDMASPAPAAAAAAAEGTQA